MTWAHILVGRSGGQTVAEEGQSIQRILQQRLGTKCHESEISWSIKPLKPQSQTISNNPEHITLSHATLQDHSTLKQLNYPFSSTTAINIIRGYNLFGLFSKHSEWIWTKSCFKTNDAMPCEHHHWARHLWFVGHLHRLVPASDLTYKLLTVWLTDLMTDWRLVFGWLSKPHWHDYTWMNNEWVGELLTDWLTDYQSWNTKAQLYYIYVFVYAGCQW